jgi:hypothetical protein
MPGLGAVAETIGDSADSLGDGVSEATAVASSAPGAAPLWHAPDAAATIVQHNSNRRTSPPRFG